MSSFNSSDLSNFCGYFRLDGNDGNSGRRFNNRGKW